MVVSIGCVDCREEGKRLQKLQGHETRPYAKPSALRQHGHKLCCLIVVLDAR